MSEQVTLVRPEILYTVYASVSTLKGVGPRVAPLLEKLAGPIVRDVAFLKPHSLIRRTPAVATAAIDGEVMTFELVIEGWQAPRVSSQPWRARAFDHTGFITLVIFGGYGAQQAEKHPEGAKRIVSGRVEDKGFGWQMVNPDYMVAPEKRDEIPEIEPVYPATAGLPSRTIRKFAQEALARTGELPEWQDAAWLAREKLPAWREAMAALHAPANEGDISPLARPRRRLAYDELLAHQLALAERRANRRAEPGRAIPPSATADSVQSDLPFKLTGAQMMALAEVRGDLASGERMARLLQGDVGSGKTVVALLAMADVAACGLQSVFMAPTEILARQHFETIAAPLAEHGITAVLLTGRDKGAGRAETLRMLADGRAAVAVGTHALFQNDVEYRALALTVIDEQHRFGVSERRRLQDKGEGVHLLAMSATPIPRTLELTLYGDLEVSRLEEKPPGRTPVATAAVPIPRMGEVVERLRKAIAGGAQAFWICPLVAESENADLMAAEQRVEDLRRWLGPSVGLVHGKMAPAAKDAVMADFAAGKLSVLTATTVVEVGVNVPNASIMVIEQAERFGLAQLHQLRGRVGRGERESACVLLYDPPLTQVAQARLDILRHTDDGFLIAEKDLELRGGGDPLGLRQSGFPAYRFADPAAHRDLIAVAADDARLVRRPRSGLRQLSAARRCWCSRPCSTGNPAANAKPASSTGDAPGGVDFDRAVDRRRGVGNPAG
jgi:ATP-dependent DNA helicase RecG